MEVIKAFIIYGFLGWTIENSRSLFDPHFSSCNPVYKYFFRGNICFIPILFLYGLGGIFILFLRKNYPNMPLLIKATILVIAFNVIELIGGWVGEKYICNKIDTCWKGHKMWDYRDNPNIYGYIDIKHTIYWIILGLIGYEVYPYLVELPNDILLISMLTIWIIINLLLRLNRKKTDLLKQSKI